jgi:hypothetical protein
MAQLIPQTVLKLADAAPAQGYIFVNSKRVVQRFIWAEKSAFG